MKNLILMIGITVSCFGTSLDTLKDFACYAQSLPENPPHTNFNPLNPDFTPYYMQYDKSATRKLVDYLLSFVGIRSSGGYWLIHEFEALLTTLVHEREKKGLNKKYIIKIVPKENAQFVVWGDMQGAFHSLIRDLVELKRLGIVDESLKVTQSDYLVFNGDFIDRSAHSIESLILMMTLMHKNPDQILYIPGNHETEQDWHDYSLKIELKLKGRGLDKENIPFDSLVQRFFKTLPLAVFIQGIDKKNKKPAYARISHYDALEMPLLNEDNFSSFLLGTQKTNPSIYFPVMRESDPKEFADVKTVIVGQSRSTTYQPTDGLQLLIPQLGATSWTILSAPTEVYNKLYKFYNDAFTILKTKEFINNWTLTLYKQDVRKKAGFDTVSYHLLSGRKLANADETLDLEEVAIGSINDITKSTATLGKALREGLALKVNKANQIGELPGKYIRMVFIDDEYTPNKTVEAMRKIKQKYGSDIILTTLGSPTQEALLPYIKDKSIAVLFGYSGAGAFRKPELTNTVHYRTSYEREAYVLVEHAVKELNMKRFAIVYQNDAFGKALRDGARMALHEFNCEWVEGSYARNTLNIQEAAQIVKNFDPEVILLFGTRAPSYALIQELGIPYVANKQIMGGSFLTDAFRYMVEPRGLSFTITRVVPDPHGNLEISKEFKKEVLASNPDDLVSVDVFEGYINASLFVEALKNIQGPITKESLMNYFHSIKDKKFKGLELSYDPDSQEISQTKEVGIDDGKKWTAFPSKGWKYSPEKALPPKKLDTKAQTVSLYVPHKTDYTNLQFIHDLITLDCSIILGTYNDPTKTNFVYPSFRVCGAD